MSKIIFFLFVALHIQISHAQTAEIRGKVTDRYGNAVSMATVMAKDTMRKVIACCFSDTAGSFHMTVTRKATELLVSSVGYQDYHLNIDVSSEQTVANIILDSAVNNLGEAVVYSRLPIAVRKIDRLIYNAERLNVAASNFLDVLERVPGIIVQNDIINMLNKGKVIVLMDGREVKMDMKALCVYLGTLNASKLRQIEVMTTPSAKYSAEGNAGIINFVTKKAKGDYYGGYVFNRLSIKEKVYNGSAASMDYKRGRLEAHANVGLGLGLIQTNNTTHIIYSQEEWNAINRRLKSNDYALATAGADYEMGKNSSVGLLVSYSNMRPDSEETGITTVTSKEGGQRARYFETTSNLDCDYNRWNANMHYMLSHIGHGGNLDFNIDYLNYDIQDHVKLQSAYDETLSYSNFPKTTISLWQAKADFAIPVGQAAFSCGIMYSASKTDNQTHYDYISAAYDLNDHFVYRENIFSAYADLKYKLSKRLETKVGLRGEYGKLNGESIKMDTRTVKRQLDFFPTAYLNYDWNNDNTLALSLSCRINRPSYVDINPFATYIDAHTVQKGNPNLLPEKSYSTDLEYTYKNISVSIGMMTRRRVITVFTSIDKNQKQVTTTTDNVMRKQMYSLDFSYYFDKTWWFDTSIDGSLYMVASRPEKGYNLERVNHVSIYLYMNNNFYFNKKKTWMANLWGQYQGKQKDVTGMGDPMFRADLAVKCLLFDKRLSVGLEFQNMLASHARTTVEADGASYTYHGKPYRVFNISLSYRFGKVLNTKKRSFGINSNRL